MSKSRLADLLSLADVKRWNSRARFLREQSVAEHTFNVMAIASELVIKLDLSRTAGTSDHKDRVMYRVLSWALVHDGPEAETGDINYLFKRGIGRREIDALEDAACPWYHVDCQIVPDWARTIVKIADKIEEYLYLKNWGANGTMEEFGPGVLDQIAHHVDAAYTAYGWSNLSSTVCGIVGTDLILYTTPPSPLPSPQAQST